MAEERVLNMVLRKEFAEQIVRGEKVCEYRVPSAYWCKRLFEWNNPTDKKLPSAIKEYDRVHFYPYNNKWFVDCKIAQIRFEQVNKGLLDILGDLEYPIGEWIFIIVLDGVIDTNLSIE